MKKEKKNTLTTRVTGQDLRFERLSEKKITRRMIYRDRVKRIMRLLKKETAVLTVVEDCRTVSRGYASIKDILSLVDTLFEKSRLDILYTSSGEVKIVLDKLGEPWDERTVV